MVFTTTMSAEDLWRMPATEWRRELWEGRLIEVAPPGPQHGSVALRIGAALLTHANERRLGSVLAEAGFLLGRDPDTVFGPDVSFVRAERIPPSGLPRQFWVGPPDLAVEVRSPNDTGPEIDRKVAIYLGAGTSLVWVVDPARRQVTVHTPGAARLSLAAHDVLDGGNVLPDFRMLVAELFDPAP